MKPNKNPLIDKLLKLKYRINNTYRNPVVSNGTLIDDTRDDKSYVMKLISDIRHNSIKFTKLFWDKVFTKLGLLQAKIESYKGQKMSIDDIEYRWVQNRIEYWNSEERVLIKEEMKVANKMWNKYNN